MLRLEKIRVSKATSKTKANRINSVWFGLIPLINQFGSALDFFKTKNSVRIENSLKTELKKKKRRTSEDMSCAIQNAESSNLVSNYCGERITNANSCVGLYGHQREILQYKC